MGGSRALGVSSLRGMRAASTPCTYRCRLALHALPRLHIAQDACKINVYTHVSISIIVSGGGGILVVVVSSSRTEQMPRAGDHDVVVVPVSDSQHVGRDAVAGARRHKVIDRLLVRTLGRVVLPQPFGQGRLLESAGDTACLLSSRGWMV